jgi:hypothetical protein
MKILNKVFLTILIFSLSSFTIALEMPVSDIALAEAATIAKRGLFKAIQDQSIDQVEMQLDFIKNMLKIAPDFTNAWGDTPLITSIKLNNTTGDEIARLLIQAGADVNQADAQNFDTPLHIAVRTANAPIAQQLIFTGADLNLINAQGRTPAQLLIFIINGLQQNGNPDNQIRLFNDLYKLLQTKPFQGA